MSIIKKNLGITILTIIMIMLAAYYKEIFFLTLLIYVLFINFLLSNYVGGKLKKMLAIIIWSAFIIILGLTVYVNYYLPHGPSYSTGEIICRNDDRGPCGEQYAEDLRGLDIPRWAKFLRQSEGEILLFSLLFAGFVVSGKNKKDES